MSAEPTWHGPTTWWGPARMAGIALRVFLVKVFRDFMDKRDLQSHYDDATYAKSAPDDLIVDYIADTGDGFTATYSVFSQLNPVNLGHPELLVFGGDQVYPMPSAKNYEERFSSPLRSAVPRAFLPYIDELVRSGEADIAQRLLHNDDSDPEWLGRQRTQYARHLVATDRRDLVEVLRLDGPAATSDEDLTLDGPAMFTIPGNHDWYDGLTSFDRIFMQAGNEIGGFHVEQHRSYWAVKLEVGGEPWWLWGVDLSLDTYVDRAQFEYFANCGAKAGDPVVLFVAAPLWTYGPHRIEHLHDFERRAIFEQGLRLMMAVAGDRHYYIRREAIHDAAEGGRRDDAPPRITAGIGGSFLQAPHLEKVTPPLWSTSGESKDELRYRAAPLCTRDLGGIVGEIRPDTFPADPESRKASSFRKSLAAWWRWNRSSLSAGFLLGLVSAAISLQTVDFWNDENLITETEPWLLLVHLFTGFNLVIVLLLLLATSALAAPDPSALHQRAQRTFWTLVHWTGQIAALWLSLWLAQLVTSNWISDDATEALDAGEGMFFLAAAGVFASISITLVLIIYLAVTSRAQMSVNALGIWNLEQNYKGVVRMRFTSDAIEVTVHGITDIKVEKPEKIWRRMPQPSLVHPEIVPLWDRDPLVLVDEFRVER